jgi:hypothetical protein
MLDRETIELTLIQLISNDKGNVNGKDLLDIRTGVAMVLAAKERHRQRMSGQDYRWKKPCPRRRQSLSQR